MTRSDAEGELNQFTSGFKRVYRYKQEFIPDHFITVTKVIKMFPDGTSQEEFEILKHESTIDIDDFNRDLFLNLLIKEQIVYNTDTKWFMKMKDMRTDSCICGAWATINPNCHAFWCRKNSGFGAGHE